MIQLNLLPDVKMEYLKAQKARRLVFSVSVLVAAASVVLLLLLLSVDGLQKKHLKDLSSDINSESSKLQKEPDINKILTVQNQLESLTDLHSQKPAASRLFSYMIELTPSKVNMTDMKVDFTAQTISITGTSDSLSNVNKYIDTLKAATYTSDANPDQSLPAFSNIVLSSFDLDTDTHDPSQSANYSITAAYDKNIFDITQDIDISVPNNVPTHSLSASSTDLFKPVPSDSSKSGGGN